MAKTEERKTVLEVARDPQTLSLIERIFYFEQFTPIQADNDNASLPNAPRQQASGSACFDSWALPDYLRH